MKIPLDLYISPRWVRTLEAAGHEAAHWSAVGSLQATDSEIMAYAAANGFVVLTQDLDFGSILAASRGRRPSVLQVRSDNLRPEAIGGAVIAALAQLGEEFAADALVTVEPGRTRLRVLPPPRPG